MLAPTALPRERFSPLAQSGGVDVHDRMSALGIAAEEIGRAPSVKSDVRDPKRTSVRCLLVGVVGGEEIFAIANDFAVFTRNRFRDQSETIVLFGILYPVVRPDTQQHVQQVAPKIIRLQQGQQSKPNKRFRHQVLQANMLAYEKPKVGFV